MQPAYDADELLRSQMEVHGLQRAPPKTPEDMMKAKATVSDLCKFSTQIGRLATRQGFPLELVFQCLLAIGVGAEVNFDKQHRQGDVPMHQAKVLNRDAANSIAPKLKAEVPAAELDDLVRRSNVMRTFLRMKVEDGNDLSMARRALTLGDEYFTRIESLASGDPQIMWALYQADDAASIHAIVRGGDAASGEGADAPVVDLKPLPANLPLGIHQECNAALMKNTEAVPKRLTALANILRWIREAPVDQVRSQMSDIHVALRKALDVQLGEKRSAITRAACDIVSALALIASPAHYNLPEIKETTSSWLGVLLKQVHVTVGAIAEATDMTVRDVAAASHGATFVFAAVSAVLIKATQPELQRRCVGYLLIGLVASESETAAKASGVLGAVEATLRSSNDGIRRVARAFVIVCESQCPGVRLSSWDDRTQKSVAEERPVIEGMLQKGLAAIEVGVLRYPSASNVARSADGTPTKSSATKVAAAAPAAAAPARVASPFVAAPASAVAFPPALHRHTELPALANRPTVASPSLEDSPTNLPTHAAPRAQPRPAPVSVRDANTFDRYAVAATRPAPLCHNRVSEVAPRPASGVPLSLMPRRGSSDNLTPEHPSVLPRNESEMLSSLKAKQRRPSREVQHH